MSLGLYPTPVQPLAGLSAAGSELWVKRDDQTHPLYGGNKVRKLEYLLAHARAIGASRLVTCGAIGSHHVLACCLHGQAAGLRVAAVLTPQPLSAHVIDNLRAALGAGLEPIVARSNVAVPLAFARLWQRGDFVVGPGGSSPEASRGYADAAFELRSQVQAGPLPLPDAIVVALGSGGTAAGLVAGCAAAGLPTRVIGVRVVDPPLVTRASTLLLALRTARVMGVAARWSELADRFVLEGRYLGRGYGYATDSGAHASKVAASAGLVLEPTYTAKAFACALDLAASGTYRTVLYWHTMSSAPLQHLVEKGPPIEQWPSQLRELLEFGAASMDSA